MKFLFILLFCILFCIVNDYANISGVTVITHGFQLDGSSIRDDKNAWVLNMAKAILQQNGGGKIYYYNRNTGLYDIDTDNGDGEVVLIFDWALESNFDGKGFSEAAGDALFSSLIRSGFPLNNLHFIAHSRGTIVNTVAVERLLHLKQKYEMDIKIDMVTNIDAHDWGEGGVGIDYHNIYPTISIDEPTEHQPNNGVISWQGVGFSDSYYQENFIEGPTLLHGRKVKGTFSKEWKKDLDGTNFVHSDFFLNPPNCTGIYNGYIKTILSTNYGLEGGYQFRIDKFSRPVLFSSKKSVEFDFFNRTPNRIRGIVNGSFDRGEDNYVPGWGVKHGGGGNAVISAGKLKFNNKQWRKHNFFYVPKDAKCLKFKFSNLHNCPNSKLEVALFLENNEKVKLTESLSKLIISDTLLKIDISEYQNKVIALELRTLGDCSNQTVLIDDVEFGKESVEDDEMSA
ncbi:MAG: hypothetical protein WCK82_15795, partial [Bacteroidota bacterium]